MKTIVIVLIVLAIGLVVTGCSKVVDTQVTSSDTQNTVSGTEDLTIGDTITNPDIGTLDDIAVSEELPQ